MLAERGIIPATGCPRENYSAGLATRIMTKRSSSGYAPCEQIAGFRQWAGRQNPAQMVICWAIHPASQRMLKLADLAPSS
ncbi:hypothetical protein ECP03048163_5104 [Escherichia coli P0304816.3]|nr:hypothetical protein ECP03048163_5104 [Escherichia coli P0304816.3]